MIAPDAVLASVVVNARFAAIAAPTDVPVAGPVVTALPSAFAVESVLPFAESVRSPPLPIERAPEIEAFCETTLMVIAIDAATCSGLLFPPLSFSELSAFGVGFVPASEPAAPFAAAVASAFPRSPATCESTVCPDGWSGESSAGAPAALAVAEEDELDAPVALNVSAPPAETLRCVVASAVCFANVSAMAAPIAAEPLDVVSPDAVVAAVAFVAALKLAAPVGESG